MQNNKKNLKNMINDNYINEEWPEFKVTSELKEDVKKHPEKYINCDVRIRMGKFYTDEEIDTYISGFLFASEAQNKETVQDIFKNELEIEELPITLRNDFSFIKLFYQKIDSKKKLDRINTLVSKIPTKSEVKLKLNIYQKLISENFNKNSNLTFETKAKFPKIIIKNLNILKMRKSIIVFQESYNQLTCKYYDYINESTHKIDISYNENHIKIDYNVDYARGGYRPTIHMKYYIIKNNENYYLIPTGRNSNESENNKYKKFEICQNELSAFKKAITYLKYEDELNKKRFTFFDNDIAKTRYPEVPKEMEQYIAYICQIIDQYYEIEDPNYIHKAYNEVRNMKKKHALINNKESLELQLAKYRKL